MPDNHVIAASIINELERALEAHPTPFHNHHEAYAVLLEEVDEYWDEVKRNPKKGPSGERLSGERLSESTMIHQQNMRMELIQIAAMACRALKELY